MHFYHLFQQFGYLSIFTSWAKLRSLKITLFFFVFCFFWWFFSNLRISMVLTIFLHILDSLLIKYDMIIFLSGFFSDFSGFSSNLQIYSQNGFFTSHLWYNDFFPGNLSAFRIFLHMFPDFFSEFSSSFQISSQNWWFTAHKLYNNFIFRKFSGFRIFSGFFRIFIKSMNLFFFLVYSAHEVGL